MADKLSAHGNAVHAFAAAMQNLGLARQVDQLMGLYRSGYWREFKDDLGTYRFLPGEFDYFLTQWGVDRANVLTFPLDAKVELEAAMDERRTGEPDYRRTLQEARAANPQRPDPIKPFGLSSRDRAAYEDHPTSSGARRSREALGVQARRVREGKPRKRPSQDINQAGRAMRALPAMDDADLEALYDAVMAERKRRASGK